MNLYWKSRNNNNRYTSVGEVVLIKEDEPSVRTEWRRSFSWSKDVTTKLEERS